MSEPTYYDFLQRTHGYYLNDGVYNELVNYEYYAGDELHTNNVVFNSGFATAEIDSGSGQVLYVENRAPITRAADQTENIKLIVEF